MQNINDLRVYFRYFKYIAIPLLLILIGGTFFLQAKSNQTVNAIKGHFIECDTAAIVGPPANPSIVNACGKTYSVSVNDRWNPFKKVTVKEAAEQS